jgi:hypothetical protein
LDLLEVTDVDGLHGEFEDELEASFAHR